MDRLTKRNPDTGLAYYPGYEPADIPTRHKQSVLDLVNRLADFEDIDAPLPELQEWDKANREGRLVVLPPKSKYGDATIDEAIRSASAMCACTNNDRTRLVLDALIEKQIRAEAENALKEGQNDG